jgi:hypothetical protein
MPTLCPEEWQNGGIRSGACTRLAAPYKEGDFGRSPRTRPNFEMEDKLGLRAQAQEYVTLPIQEVFENFNNYRRGWSYFEEGEWKDVYGIFSRPAGDFYVLEFEDVVETRNVSRKIPKDTVVQLRRGGRKI